MAESSKRRKIEFTIAENAWLINYAGRNSNVSKNDLGKALCHVVCTCCMFNYNHCYTVPQAAFCVIEATRD